MVVFELGISDGFVVASLERRYWAGHSLDLIAGYDNDEYMKSSDCSHSHLHPIKPPIPANILALNRDISHIYKRKLTIHGALESQR